MRQFLLTAAASVLGLALATPAYADDDRDGYKGYLKRLKRHHKRQRELDKKQQKRYAEMLREQQKRYEKYSKEQAKREREWFKGGKGHFKKGWRSPAARYSPGHGEIRPVPPARLYPGWGVEPRYNYSPPGGYILPPDWEDDHDDD